MTDKPTLLVAEDDESSFLLLQMLLKKDYQIEHAINGLEAVRMVKEGSYDAVLMDIRMPEMDGLEALRQIRKFNETIPAVMQTANAFDSDKESSIEAGCSGFITKPIMASQLKETLKNVLGGVKKEYKTMACELVPFLFREVTLTSYAF